MEIFSCICLIEGGDFVDFEMVSRIVFISETGRQIIKDVLKDSLCEAIGDDSRKALIRKFNKPNVVLSNDDLYFVSEAIGKEVYQCEGSIRDFLEGFLCNVN